MKILLIDDDAHLTGTITSALEHQYEIDVAHTAETAEEKIDGQEYDLYLIDLVLPDGDGSNLCRYIRQSGSPAPILMLTGQTEIPQKVNALDAGADDYLVKPFHLDELKARLRALLRRRSTEYQDNILTFGPITLNTITNTVTYNGQVITLRRKEYDLLEILLRNAGRVVTRSMILDHVWNTDTDPTTNTIDVHIKTLRDRLDRAFGANLIKTIYGRGYKLDL